MLMRCLALLFRLFLIFGACYPSSAEAAEICTQAVQKSRLGADEAYLNLLQSHAQLKSATAAIETGSRIDAGSRATRQKPVCRELTNRGAYHTITVEVGTPAQEFNVVADSGSNMLIVPGCQCIDSGSCGGLSTCFKPGKSESFQIETSRFQGQKVTKLYALYFGSGQINVIQGTDVVRLGSVKGTMEDSVMVMQERKLDKIASSFEGLFGLGRPRSPDATTDPTMLRNLFLKMAGVDRYSICFNAEGETGSLQMNVPELSNPMESVGELHWAFDLQGMSVGSTGEDTQFGNTGAGKVLFCSPDTKKRGQQTACNAVPDSGTTLIKGPPGQISKLFVALCSAWPRCKEYHTQNLGMDKGAAFQSVLSNCGEWMGEADGLDEIPPVNVHLAGIDGKQQIVSLPPWTWVSETSEQIFNYIQQNLFENASQKAFPQGSRANYCVPMFQANTQSTEENGPQWILGSPFFYAKVVSFDISADPPLIDVSNSLCSACDGDALLKDGVPLRGHADRTDRRTLRRLDVFPRSSIWDSSQRL